MVLSFGCSKGVCGFDVQWTSWIPSDRTALAAWSFGCHMHKKEKRKDVYSFLLLSLHHFFCCMPSRAGSHSGHFFTFLFANVLFQLVIHDVSPSSNLNVPMFTMQLLKLRLRAATFFWLCLHEGWQTCDSHFALFYPFAVRPFFVLLFFFPNIFRFDLRSFFLEWYFSLRM